MIVNMRYNPATKTTDIVNSANGETLLRNVPLREVADVLAQLRYALAQQRAAARKGTVK